MKNFLKKIAVIFSLVALIAGGANIAKVSAGPLTIVEAVEQGKQALAQAKLSYLTTPQYKTVTTGKGKKKKTSKVISGYNLTQKDIALAIFDPATSEIKVTFGKQKSGRIRL